MSRDMQEPVKWDREAIYSLLRFGRKNDGPWNDSAGIDKDGRELGMPDDDDTDIVAAAPDLYEALEEALKDWDDSHFDEEYPYKIEWADKARAAARAYAAEISDVLPQLADDLKQQCKIAATR